MMPARSRLRSASVAAALAAVLGLAPGLAGPALAEPLGDVGRGEALFQRHCQACHQVGPGAANRIGPHLNNVFDRRAGTVAGVQYSRSMTRMGADGMTWTLERLDAYLENPRALVSGTRMNYRGLKDPVERWDVIAYLREFSDMPQNIPESAPTARKTPPGIDPALLDIVGDAEYGEYLAQECTTCHQRDGTDRGIPAITGWPPDDFVIAMHAYRIGLRPHQVMEMMARRLADDQIAALAAYFGGLD